MNPKTDEEKIQYYRNELQKMKSNNYSTSSVLSGIGFAIGTLGIGLMIDGKGLFAKDRSESEIIDLMIKDFEVSIKLGINPDLAWKIASELGEKERLRKYEASKEYEPDFLSD